MVFKGIDFRDVKKNAVYDANLDAYVYKLGNAVEVTVRKRANRNMILSNLLSSNVVQDKFMIKYVPSNVILFDTDIVDSVFLPTHFSCEPDMSYHALRVGMPNKYKIITGTLFMSGSLSANGFVEENREIRLGSQSSTENIIVKTKVLGVGLRGERLYGVLHIPNERSIAINADSSHLGYSVMSGQVRNCLGWSVLTIEDWFEGATCAEYNGGSF